MRTPRILLLIAAALLVAAELVSLPLVMRMIGQRHAQRTQSALDRAGHLLPRLADWIRTRGAAPGETVDVPWIEPFDRLAIVRPEDFSLSNADAARLQGGELVVTSLAADPDLHIVGSVQTDRGPVIFRLTQTSSDTPSVAIDRILIAQHALILLAALMGFLLAAMGRGPSDAEATPSALRAYEEAMSRIRRRDHERVAAFDREKDQLISVLKDRETMARAGELTAGIVHEVRNSLGAISMQAKSFEKSEEERTRSAAASIGEEVLVLQTIMTRFLDFIRNEKLQEGQFDLKKLVDRVSARERANTGSRIEVEGAPTLVRGDEDLLERAIENVIRNAGQAAGPGGLVNVRFGADLTHAFVIVEDTGPGIVDIEKAIRPFESARPGGLGLGLPLVLKILTLHNGALELGSRPGSAGVQAICRWPREGKGATAGNSEPADLKGKEAP